MAPTTLHIPGFDGEPVPNALFAREGSDHLAIVLPGLSYGAMMPALFYPWKLLLEMGASVLRVDYEYARPERKGDSRERMAERFTADVAAAAAAGLATGEYRRVTLLGKSLGTLAMAHLLGGEPRLAGADCIWLTPLLRDERLRARVAGAGPRSLFVIGTADAEYDQGMLDELRDATGGESLVLPGADHGLEIPGDIMTSIDYLAEVTRRIAAFVDAGRDRRADETEK